MIPDPQDQYLQRTPMTLPLMLLFFAIAVTLWALRWRRTGWSILAVTAIVFLAIGCGPLAQWLLDRVQNDEQGAAPVWGERPALVVLGAGTEQVGSFFEPGALAYGRIVKAARLYHDCAESGRTCTLIVSGGDLLRRGSSEADVYAGQLIGLGVPATSIRVENKSHNTWQNAKFTADLLRELKSTQVLVVTSGVHVRRSLAYFGHFGITPVGVRSDFLSAKNSVLPTAYNFTMADIAIHEIIGMYRFHLYNKLGLNEPPRK